MRRPSRRRLFGNTPILRARYVDLRAIALVAHSPREPEHQVRFVSRVREAFADDIQSGEPLITVRVREAPQAGRQPTSATAPDELAARVEDRTALHWWSG